MIEQPFEKFLPRLIEKIYSTGQRCLFNVQDEDLIDDWNKLLWTFAQKSFLPHGCEKDGNPKEQPIWLTYKDENPNNSSVYITFDSQKTFYENGFKKAIEVFSLTNKYSLDLAKKRIKEYTGNEEHIKIWKQTCDGKWQNLKPSQVVDI